jgi:hypothetical protein
VKNFTQRVVRKCGPRSRRRIAGSKDQTWASPLEGMRPLRPSMGTRCTRGLPGARRGQSWHRHHARPQRACRVAASNLDTHSTWVGRGAHAVEFSKTAAPHGEGCSLSGAHPRSASESRGRTDEYSTSHPKDSSGRSPPAETSLSHDRTWTVTERVRGLSSKSITTICCQVPSTSAPSTIGMLSDGPISAARRCA